MYEKQIIFLYDILFINFVLWSCCNENIFTQTYEAKKFSFKIWSATGKRSKTRVVAFFPLCLLLCHNCHIPFTKSVYIEKQRLLLLQQKIVPGEFSSVIANRFKSKNCGIVEKSLSSTAL